MKFAIYIVFAYASGVSDEGSLDQKYFKLTENSI